MHQTKKRNQGHFGIKCHSGADADSGLVHTVAWTAVNVNDVTQAGKLVHGEETDVLAEAGYQGVAKREEVKGIEANWHVTMRPGKGGAQDYAHGGHPGQAGAGQAETPNPFHKAAVRLHQGELPGLVKNTANLVTLFALSNLWMAWRSHLLGLQG